jgi:hypothetical protein
MHTRFVTTILFVLILSACAPSAQVSLPTQTSQPVIAPTVTALPATSTPTLLPTKTSQPTITPTFTELPATSTPKPSVTPTLKSDMGTLVPNWQGIPVIPGANQGKPAGPSYTFSVNITIEEAEKFYTKQMGADGWILSNRQTSTTSLFGGPSTALDFQRGNEAVNIMLIFSTNDNYTMVILTQVKS